MGIKPKEETRDWYDKEGDEIKERDARSNSPTNITNVYYRFTNCQFCEEQLVTRKAHTGQLTCRQCTLRITSGGFETNETETYAESTQVADTTETQTPKRMILTKLEPPALHKHLHATSDKRQRISYNEYGGTNRKMEPYSTIETNQLYFTRTATHHYWN